MKKEEAKLKKEVNIKESLNINIKIKIIIIITIVLLIIILITITTVLIIINKQEAIVLNSYNFIIITIKSILTMP